MKEHEFRMIRRFNNLLILIFLAMIYTPMAGQVFKLDADTPETENRQLAKRPAFPVTMKEAKAFPQSFNVYADNWFGFRGTLLFWHSWVKWQLGMKISSKVLRGKDGWLFLYKRDNVVSQYRGIDCFSLKELCQWVQAMMTRRQWLAERGIPFIVVVAPNKHSIYPEYLPGNIGPVVRETRLDQLVHYIEKYTDLDFIDLREPLQKAKQQTRVFYKTDSHWNDMGGFYGARELLKRVKKYFPEVKPLTFEDYDLQEETRPGGDLAQMLNLQDFMPERVPVLIPNFPTWIREHKASAPQAKPWDRRMYFTSARSEMPTAVIFHDSFIWGMRRFLSENFHRTIFAPHNLLYFDTELVEREKPDLVIYELIERLAGQKIKEPLASGRQGLDENRITFIDRKTAQEMLSKNDQVFQDIRFGEEFNLLGVMSRLTEEGLRLDLVWESLKGQHLKYINFVHVVDSAGNILGNADYEQDAAKRFVSKGTIWHDSVLLPAEKLHDAAAIGFGVYLPPGTFFIIDHGPTDWDQSRLLMEIKYSWQNPAQAKAGAQKEKTVNRYTVPRINK